jgi:CRP/FNR family transcriptional regulator
VFAAAGKQNHFPVSRGSAAMPSSLTRPPSLALPPIILTSFNRPWEKILSSGTAVTLPAKRLITGKTYASLHGRCDPPTDSTRKADPTAMDVTKILEETDAGMYYIKRGLIRLSHIALNGQELMLLYMGKDTLFGEIPMFLAGREYLFTSMEETEAVFLPKKMLTEDFIRKHPELILNLLQSLSKKTQLYYYQLCSLHTFTTFGNLCRALYSMYLHQRKRDHIVPRLAQQELAAFLGVHRSSLHKAMTRLRAEGIIGGYSKSVLEILDIDRLAGYCGESII